MNKGRFLLQHLWNDYLLLLHVKQEERNDGPITKLTLFDGNGHLLNQS